MARIEPRLVRARTGETIELRTPTPDDADALVEFVERATATTDQILTLPDEVVTREQESGILRDWLEHPRNLLIVATHEGRIIADLGMRTPSKRRAMHVAEFGLMCLAEWRARGVGRAVITELIRFGERHPDIHKLALSVFATNEPALGLYRSMGFEVEGVRKAHARQPTADGGWSYLDLVEMGLWIGSGGWPGPTDRPESVSPRAEFGLPRGGQSS